MTLRSVGALYTPLALSSLLGTLAPVVINAAIVRASLAPDLPLAAYGVARNLIFLMSPFAVMVPTAVLVLVAGPRSRRKLLLFLLVLGMLLAALGLVTLVVPFFRDLLLRTMLGLDKVLSYWTRAALYPLLAYPLLSIWRGFLQGLLIKQRRTGVTIASGGFGFAVCLAGVAAAAFVRGIPGAVYGALLLVVSTAADAAFLQVAVKARRARREQAEPLDAAPTIRQILRYFLPLMITTLIMAASRTVIDAGLARTINPSLALAAFNVAISVVFAFESPVVMLRNIVLAYDHTGSTIRLLRRFSLAIGAGLSALLLIAMFLPMGVGLFSSVVGLQGPTARVALWDARIASLALVILSWRQFNYGLLMKRERTDIIALSAIVRMVFLILGLLIGLSIWSDSRVAAIVYTAGFIAESLVTQAGAARIGIFRTAAGAVSVNEG